MIQPWIVCKLTFFLAFLRLLLLHPFALASGTTSIKTNQARYQVTWFWSPVVFDREHLMRQ